VLILPSDLMARGYRQSGVVRPDPTPLHFAGRQGRGLFEVVIARPADGWVTYVHVLEDEFKKAGKTDNDESFAGRMRSSYYALRRTIELMNNGMLRYVGDVLYRVDSMTGESMRPYEEDFPWKHRVPVALLEGRLIELWAKSHLSRNAMLLEECKLNRRYRGEWAREGWTRDRRRHTPDLRDERLLEDECRRRLKLQAD
jgi:hypothetical protein